MSEMYEQADRDLLFTPPTWITLAEVPMDTPFFTRRGLAYVRTTGSSCKQLYDEDEVSDDDYDEADVFDDWPYWSIPDDEVIRDEC